MYLQVSYQVSERRACGVLDFSRSTHRYLSVADAHEELRIRLRDLATARPNWSDRRLGLLHGVKGCRSRRAAMRVGAWTSCPTSCTPGARYGS